LCLRQKSRAISDLASHETLVQKVLIIAAGAAAFAARLPF